MTDREKSSKEKQYSYSHTQLSLYRACPRKWHDTYVLGFKDATTPAMAYGTLVHGAIEAYISEAQGAKPMWEALWAEFLASFGGTNDFADPVLTLKTAKKCLDLYKASPIEGTVQAVEEKLYYAFPDGLRYVSIPDFIVGRDVPIPVGSDDFHLGHKHFTVDLKWTSAWDVKPLLPYDDQCLGQAICANADGFIRVTFKGDKKTGKVMGPYIEEQMVDPVLKAEWIREIWDLCGQIQGMVEDKVVFPKNPATCYAYGKPCHRMMACKGGAVDIKRDRA